MTCEEKTGGSAVRRGKSPGSIPCSKHDPLVVLDTDSFAQRRDERGVLRLLFWYYRSKIDGPLSQPWYGASRATVILAHPDYNPVECWKQRQHL
jgi:hypothetical protein